ADLRISEGRDDDGGDGEVERVRYEVDGDGRGARQEGRDEASLRDRGDGWVAGFPDERRREVASIGRELHQRPDVDLDEERRDEQGSRGGEGGGDDGPRADGPNLIGGCCIAGGAGEGRARRDAKWGAPCQGKIRNISRAADRHFGGPYRRGAHNAKKCQQSC